MSIQQFKSAVNELSRPNRFLVTGGAPFLPPDTRFLAKGSSLPSATLGAMDVNYMGRAIKYAGDRVYDDWEITCYQDNTANLRRAIDGWMQSALSHRENQGALSWTEYKADLTVVQLDRRDNPIMEYRLIGCVPISLGALELAWETNDTPAEFPVTFAYDYYDLF